MNHHNGISDFNANSLEEREAEIFAGIVLLPDSEIRKWMNEFSDIMQPSILAKMSVYYQMSFNGVMVRSMQLNPVSREKFLSLKALSNVNNVDKLNAIYIDNSLTTEILQPSNDIRISSNIMSILKHNFENGLISGAKINEIIEKIEVLNND